MTSPAQLRSIGGVDTDYSELPDRPDHMTVSIPVSPMPPPVIDGGSRDPRFRTPMERLVSERLNTPKVKARIIIVGLVALGVLLTLYPPR